MSNNPINNTPESRAIVVAEAPGGAAPSSQPQPTPRASGKAPSPADTFAGFTLTKTVTGAKPNKDVALAAPRQTGVALGEPKRPVATTVAAAETAQPGVAKPTYVPPPEIITIEIPNRAANHTGRLCGRSPTNYEWDFACDGVPNGALPLVGTNWEYIWDGDGDGIPGWTVP